MNCSRHKGKVSVVFIGYSSHKYGPGACLVHQASSEDFLSTPVFAADRRGRLTCSYQSSHYSVQRKVRVAWGCSTVVECYPTMWEVLDNIPGGREGQNARTFRGICHKKIFSREASKQRQTMEWVLSWNAEAERPCQPS